MKTILELQNVKCQGCVDNVMKALKQIPELENVSLTLDTKTLSFEHPADLPLEAVKDKLRESGYPARS